MLKSISPSAYVEIASSFNLNPFGVQLFMAALTHPPPTSSGRAGKSLFTVRSWFDFCWCWSPVDVDAAGLWLFN